MVDGQDYNAKQKYIIDNWRQAAVEGDATKGQRMIDRWWEEKTPGNLTPGVWLHGGIKPEHIQWNTFDTNRIGITDEGFAGRGIYFTPTRVATPDENIYQLALKNGYLGPHGEVANGLVGGRYRRPFYLYSTERYPDIEGFDITAQTGFPAVIKPKYETAVGHTNQFKLTSPFTYDDSGNLIDITKRFNFKNSDIRDASQMAPSSTISLEESEFPARFINRGKGAKRVRGEYDYTTLDFEKLFNEAQQTAQSRSIWAKEHYKYDNILNENFEVNTKFPKIEIDPNNNYTVLVNGEPAYGSYVPIEHKVRLPKKVRSSFYSTQGEVESIPYHELLHAAGVKTPFYTDIYKNKTVENALSKLTDYRDSYYTSYKELPVYGLELGRLVGVKPYENAYPGIERMKEIVSKLQWHPIIKNMKHTEEGYQALYDWLRGTLISGVGLGVPGALLYDQSQSYKLGGQIKKRIKL